MHARVLQILSVRLVVLVLLLGLSRGCAERSPAAAGLSLLHERQVAADKADLGPRRSGGGIRALEAGRQRPLLSLGGGLGDLRGSRGGRRRC